MSKRGFTILELLVVIAIISILASFLFGAISGMFKRAHGTEDLSNTRQVYVAVTIYEMDNNEYAPEHLGLTARYAKSTKVYDSKLDPRPKDPNLPGWTPVPLRIRIPDRVPYRISYPYLRTFMTAYHERSDNFGYAFHREHPGATMIANPWVGNVLRFVGGIVEGQSQDSTYGPLMDGPVDRIRMDGSYFRVPSRQDRSCLGAGAYDMFWYLTK